MLSNNNMLALPGSRQRSRGYVTVDEPAHGFFITGSSILAMNGVYIRMNPPRVSLPNTMLYYKNEENNWRMLFNQLPETEETEDEHDNDDYRYLRRHKKRPDHEWLFMDELGIERFIHDDGDTIIPGAGVRWKHLHRNTATSAAPRKNVDDSSDDDDDEETFLERRNNVNPNAVANIVEDDEDELPWQVIALLDRGIMEQLVYSNRHRKRKVAEALAGKNAPKPSHASLESCAAVPGSWLFLVVSADATLFVAPDIDSEDAGIREKGEYLRGIALSSDGEWLQLDAEEDTENPSGSGSGMSRQRFDQFYNKMYGKRQLWVRLQVGNQVCLEEVPPEDTAVVDMQDLDISSGENINDEIRSAAAVTGTTTGDLFDKPFVPRVDEGEVNQQGELVAQAAVDTNIEEFALQKVVSLVNEAIISGQQEAPVGSAVVIVGLRTRSAAQYNNVTGVVIAPLDAATGRQGVRLSVPFSGKILSLKPCNLGFFEDDHDEPDSASSGGGGVTLSGDAVRSARLLGLKPSQLVVNTDSANATASEGYWGFGGVTAEQKINTALRASMRDLRDDLRARDLALQAAETLRRECVTVTRSGADTSGADISRSPVTMLRSGVIGPGIAAAVVSAQSSSSTEEQNAGIEALQEIIEDGLACYRDPSLFPTVSQHMCDNGSGDVLLLRLALVQTLLDCRREKEALDEALRTQAFYASFSNSKSCSCVEFLLARCQFRRGLRTEAILTLEEAESAVSEEVSVSDVNIGWLRPIWIWGRIEASRLLEVHRSVERCRAAAVELYSRGSFQDAASLYSRAISLLQAGLPDDKFGKSTTYADRAGCNRRDRKLDDAVADLDASLKLFPRYTRAIFRRAACLLEQGKATEAIEGFKDLYRIDRNWPILSEWLVRAYALQKRQSKGYKHPEGESYGGNPSSASGGNTPYSSQKSGESFGGEDAEKVALAVDHYAVLGVTTDATEKQLKTAYRMRSLQFHPDRKSGSTAAFQRVAEAYHVLSDADKRRDYDEGKEIKVKRGRGVNTDDDEDDDDDEDEDEEHKTTLREEVEREYYPERYQFWPFGDPFIYKRKRESQKRAREGKPSWFEEY